MVSQPVVHWTRRYAEGVAVPYCGQEHPHHCTLSITHVTCRRCLKWARNMIHKRQGASVGRIEYAKRDKS